MHFIELSYFLIFFFFLEVGLSLGKKKPANNYFDLCRRNDPDINTCIERSMTKSLPLLVKGIPDIKLPGMDPMYMTQLNMKEGEGNFRFSLVMNNVTMEGLKTTKIENFRLSFLNETHIAMEFSITQPWLSFRSQYSMDGRVIVIPVQGNGDLFLNFTSPYSSAKVKSHIVMNEEDKKNHLIIDSFGWKISIKGGKSHFSNLFNGDKRLGNTINKFFNDNFMEIFSTFKQLPEQAFDYVFRDFANIIFRSFPLDELILQG